MYNTNAEAQDFFYIFFSVRLGARGRPFAPLEQPRRLHPLRPRRERWCRTAPAQRREILEEEREIAPFAENMSALCAS
jgi:hypothetical protein